ncbi:MAG: type 4a pilus biogenesis protein PilO [Myxococcales bacterium]|nr:type 4a pilus biogenesis protein PilO [Myxococcales bacterium]
MEISPGLEGKLEQIAKLPPAARAAIVFGVSALVAVAYYFTAYAGNHDELQRLRVNEAELQRKLGEVRSVASNLAAFEEEIAALESKLTRVLRQLPNKKELEVLLTDISNLGKTAGIEMKSFRRQDEIVHDFYAEVPISIELDGRFHDLVRFFDMVAKLPRIVNMGSLSIRVSSEDFDQTRLRISGTATTFRFVARKGSA